MCEICHLAGIGIAMMVPKVIKVIKERRKKMSKSVFCEKMGGMCNIHHDVFKSEGGKTTCHNSFCYFNKEKGSVVKSLEEKIFEGEMEKSK